MDTFLLHVLDVISFILYYIVGFIGELIGLVISIFTKVIVYNGFLNEEPVILGWTIVRDLCNMGFVVILLIIAIASILQIESYGYKNRLFKILIMAVLINFSKMFTGLLIDASQYVMLEFAVGINSIGGGNFMDVLQINTLLSTNFSQNFDGRTLGDNTNISLADLFVTVILAFVVALVALVVVTALTIVVIIRIVALWILIILSPVAYLVAFSPVGSKYSSQWWSKFSQWTVTGPVMLFFVWLSLSTLKGVMDSAFSFEGGPSVGIADIGSTAVMGSFLLAIVFLMASLMVAQQLGGIAGKVAGGAYSAITNRAQKTLKGGVSLGKRTAYWTGRKADTAQMGVQSNLASGLSTLTGGRLGSKWRAKSGNYRMIQEGFKRDKERDMNKYEKGKPGAWQDTFERSLTMYARNPFAGITSSYTKDKETGKRSWKGLAGGKVKKLSQTNDDLQRSIHEGDFSPDMDKLENSRGQAIGSATTIEEKKEIASQIMQDNNRQIRKYKKSQIAFGPSVTPQNEMKDVRNHVDRHQSDVRKLQLSEEGLVDEFEREGDVTRKWAIQREIDLMNGSNTQMAEAGLVNNFKNKRQHLIDNFGELAGDVAADRSTIGAQKGNYSNVGFATLNASTGRMEVVTDEKDQSRIARVKMNELYDQNFSRTFHPDSLYQRDEYQNPIGISETGREAILSIATTAGRQKEIAKGNYAPRVVENIGSEKTDRYIDKWIDEGGLSEGEITSIREMQAKFKEQVSKGQVDLAATNEEVQIESDEERSGVSGEDEQVDEKGGGTDGGKKPSSKGLQRDARRKKKRQDAKNKTLGLNKNKENTDGKEGEKGGTVKKSGDNSPKPSSEFSGKENLTNTVNASIDASTVSDVKNEGDTINFEDARKIIRESGSSNNELFSVDQLRQIENINFKLFKTKEQKAIKGMLDQELKKLGQKIQASDKHNDRELIGQYESKRDTLTSLRVKMKDHDEKSKEDSGEDEEEEDRDHIRPNIEEDSDDRGSFVDSIKKIFTPDK